MAKARSGTCSVCGKSFKHSHATGPIPKTCPEHRGSHNRARQARAAEAAGDQKAALQLGRRSMGTLPDHLRAGILAIGMGYTPDLTVAASLAGVEWEKKRDLNRLARLARKFWPGLVEGSPLELQRLLDMIMRLEAMHLVAEAQNRAPGSRSHLMPQMAKTMQMLNDNSAGAYSDRVTVVISNWRPRGNGGDGDAG
ncbi:MAG: hypothetical protein AAF851_05730 [Myxococcota bacterium]